MHPMSLATERIKAELDVSNQTLPIQTPDPSRVRKILRRFKGHHFRLLRRRAIQEFHNAEAKPDQACEPNWLRMVKKSLGDG